MNRLRFGTAGIPLGALGKATTLTGIPYLRQIGLDAMELEFVRSVHVKEETAPLVKEAAKKNDIVLTCHGQYYVNLNAKDHATLKASVERVLKACEMAWKAGAWSICFHMAHYMGAGHDEAYEKIKVVVKEIVKKLKDTSNGIWLRPETGGKIAQFSDIEGLVKLSQEVEQVLPCIDWAHHYARSLGKCNDKGSFAEILSKIENALGKEALRNMHMHIEGIEYGDKGEKSHKIFSDSGFNYMAVLEAVKEFNVNGVMISESPNLEGDAIIARDHYAAL